MNMRLPGLKVYFRILFFIVELIANRWRCMYRINLLTYSLKVVYDAFEVWREQMTYFLMVENSCGDHGLWKSLFDWPKVRLK